MREMPEAISNRSVRVVFIGVSSTERIRALTRRLTSADGVEEACVADLGGVLREFDIDPCDDITERTVPEGPSRPLRGLQVVVADLLKAPLPPSPEPAEPLAYVVGSARPRHALA